MSDRRAGSSATNPVWDRSCRHRRPQPASAQGCRYSEREPISIRAFAHGSDGPPPCPRSIGSSDPPSRHTGLSPPQSTAQSKRRPDATDAVLPLGCPSPAISRFPSYRQSPAAMLGPFAGSRCDPLATRNGSDCVGRLRNSRPPVFLSVSLSLIPDRGRDCVAEGCSNRRNTVRQTVKP